MPEKKQQLTIEDINAITKYMNQDKENYITIIWLDGELSVIEGNRIAEWDE